jgi:hypothetical protein
MRISNLEDNSMTRRMFFLFIRHIRVGPAIKWAGAPTVERMRKE